MNLEIPTELPAIPEPPDLKKYFRYLATALAVNAVIVLAIALYWTPMIAAKCLFVEITVGAALVCIALFLLRADIFNLLAEMEMLAEVGRDETTVQMRLGRAQLRQIAQKIENTVHPPEAENAMTDLLHHAMPVMQILMAKEKNWLQLGMFGWRLAQDAMKVMKQRSS